MRVSVQTGPDKAPADVVDVDDGEITLQFVRRVGDTNSFLPVGQPYKFSLRSNGRYVVVGAKRDTGPYIVEADVERIVHAKDH